MSLVNVGNYKDLLRMLLSFGERSGGRSTKKYRQMRLITLSENPALSFASALYKLLYSGTCNGEGIHEKSSGFIGFSFGGMRVPRLQEPTMAIRICQSRWTLIQ